MTEFKCGSCGKNFKWKQGLKFHINLVHKSKGNEEINSFCSCDQDQYKKVIPFQCEYCDRRFLYRENVKKHMMKSHKEYLKCFVKIEIMPL